MGAAIIAAVVAMWTSGCPAEEDPPDGPDCVCDGDGCPEDVCNIALELPESCTFASATVLLDGEAIGSARPGDRFASCEQALGTGESAQVSVETADQTFATGPAETTCETGGDSVVAAFCTLHFGLGDSCQGVIETATVVVEGTEVGEIAVDEPLEPCFLLPVGGEATGAIRGGTQLVLTAPLHCSAPGAQASLIMECPE